MIDEIINRRWSSDERINTAFIHAFPPLAVENATVVRSMLLKTIPYSRMNI